MAPPILTGHGFDAPGPDRPRPGHAGPDPQVGRGHRHGQLRNDHDASLRIVGTATMPAVGVGGVTGHPSMGTGAVVPYQLLPRLGAQPVQRHPAGPNAVFVRLKPGADHKAALRSLQPHRRQAVDPDELLEPGAWGAEAGRDRQLPLDGRHAADPRSRVDGRGGDRARSDPHRLGPSPAALHGHAADARVHGSSAGGERGLAVERRRGDRARGRRAARDRRSGGTCGISSPTNIYVVPSPTVPGLADRGHRARCPRARQLGRRHPGAYRGPDACGTAVADRVRTRSIMRCLNRITASQEASGSA